jgi:hypothetical protein
LNVAYTSCTIGIFGGSRSQRSPFPRIQTASAGTEPVEGSAAPGSRPVVSAEDVAIGADLVGFREHSVERGGISVNVERNR